MLLSNQGPASYPTLFVRSWDIQAVRLPLNEDCWLEINGYPAAQYSSATYQQTIVSYVNLLTSNNVIVILDLHWAAPGTTQANKQSLHASHRANRCSPIPPTCCTGTGYRVGSRRQGNPQRTAADCSRACLIPISPLRRSQIRRHWYKT
jgi:hypothetical protein